jgi:hypothetical protein
VKVTAKWPLLAIVVGAQPTPSFIRRTKVLGFTLAEIRMMLGLREPGRKASKRLISETERKMLEVDRKIGELQALKTLLGQALVRCSDGCFDAGCEVLDAPVASKNAAIAAPVQVGRKPGSGSYCG